jgi:hypothetical protein
MKTDPKFCAEVAATILRLPEWPARYLVYGQWYQEVMGNVCYRKMQPAAGKADFQEFKPDVDANDDYLVLKEVQRTWDTPEIPAVVEGCAFMTELAEIYKERTCCKGAMHFALHCSLYQVGDYSRAALIALQAEQAQI